MTQHRPPRQRNVCGSVAMAPTDDVYACAKRSTQQSNKNTGVEKLGARLKNIHVFIESFNAFFVCGSGPGLATSVEPKKM